LGASTGEGQNEHITEAKDMSQGWDTVQVS